MSRYCLARGTAAPASVSPQALMAQFRDPRGEERPISLAVGDSPRRVGGCEVGTSLLFPSPPLPTLPHTSPRPSGRFTSAAAAWLPWRRGRRDDGEGWARREGGPRSHPGLRSDGGGVRGQRASPARTPRPRAGSPLPLQKVVLPGAGLAVWLFGTLPVFPEVEMSWPVEGGRCGPGASPGRWGLPVPGTSTRRPLSLPVATESSPLPTSTPPPTTTDGRGHGEGTAGALRGGCLVMRRSGGGAHTGGGWEVRLRVQTPTPSPHLRRRGPWPCSSGLAADGVSSCSVPKAQAGRGGQRLHSAALVVLQVSTGGPSDLRL